MDSIIGILTGTLVLAFYLLPSIAAYVRGHKHFEAIMILNILAGWTLIGWLAAAVWACTAPWADRHHAARDRMG